MGERLQKLTPASAAAFVAASLVAATPADAVARSAGDVQRAEQRFESTATGLRRDLSRRQDLAPEAIQRLNDVHFVYRRSARPEARGERRFGVVQIIVSDGWMALAEQLLSAAAMPNQSCARAYVRTVADIEHVNRRISASGQRAGLKAWPTLSDYLDAADQPACRGVSMLALRQPRRAEAIAAGLDAALTWTIVRQLTALPCTLPPPASSFAASAAPVASVASVAQGPASAGLSAGCAPVDPDAATLAWALATELDLRAAAPVVLAHFALICSDSCGQGQEAFKRVLTDPASTRGTVDAPALDLAKWSEALAP